MATADSARTSLGVRAVRWITDALFPRACLGCGRSGSWCCPTCFAHLSFRRTLQCPACGEASELGSFCAPCQGNRALAGLWPAQPYGHPLVREMVRTLKFKGVTELAPVLGELLVATLRTYALPPSWHAVSRERWFLCPVPLHLRRLRGRGFNQAELLARYVCVRSGLTLAPVLRRRRSTKPQSELRDEARHRNVAHAFTLAPHAAVAGNAYILVDDVYTSGTTMEECARVLKEAGAAEVWGLVVAKG